MDYDWSSGIPLSFMALCLLWAIVAEGLAFRKSRAINPWTPVSVLVLGMLQVYWLGWHLVGPAQEDPATYTPDQKSQYATYLALFAFMFLPIMIMMFRHLQRTRLHVGVAISLFRLIPCAGVSFMFFRHLLMASEFMSRMAL
ncbi:MAG: hypothetical protein ACI97A_002720 [Planctomycetota bacterium]|jgi:hypothetical protein